MYFTQETNPSEDRPSANDQTDYQEFENAYYNDTYQKVNILNIQKEEEAYELDQEQELKNEKNKEEAVNMNHMTETQNGCYSCHKTFLFNNKLHKHVHNRCNNKKLTKQKLNKTIQKSKFIKLPRSILIRSIASLSPYVSINYDFQG